MLDEWSCIFLKAGCVTANKASSIKLEITRVQPASKFSESIHALYRKIVNTQMLQGFVWHILDCNLLKFWVIGLENVQIFLVSSDIKLPQFLRRA